MASHGYAIAFATDRAHTLPITSPIPMQKPQMSFWQIWNMSFGFLGIQFGWGLQMANMSAIYKIGRAHV